MKKTIAVYFVLFIISSANAEKNHSLTFAQAAEFAVSFSPELKHAQASLALSEGTWKMGRRVYFPKFSLSVSENDRLQEFGPDSFLKNYGINLDQFLWDGGRTALSRRLEKAELQLSSSKLDRMAFEIAETAITAYRNLLSSRAILEIKKRSLSVLEEQRRILNEEVQLGLALPVDLANADINLADTNLGIYSLELDLSEMEKQFIELLGLDFLPELIEKVDINRSVTLPLSEAASALAKEKNPDLAEARFLITKRQAEVKYQSFSWIPSLRLTGNFGLSGQRYPLTRYNWSAGVNIEFSNPWFQNRITAQAGFEPPHDRTAVLQNNFTPLPDPASAAGKKQAKLALALEQENYENLFSRIGRIAAAAVEKCALAEKKRLLALEAITLGAERCRIEEIRLNLGQITRLKLMETLIEQTQKEITAVEAAVSLLEAQRQLEQLMDLKPGELESFSNTSNNLQRRN
ncbi:MAG: TolC family protein [Treponema sp.]|nr:TolC family protein [Treponema sp.]MCL2272363.1 TolC family protein [Treponema sp.]